MILAGTEIKRRVEDGSIVIDPFEPAHLNSASIDLTLGSTVAVYEDFTYCGAADGEKGVYDGHGLMGQPHHVLDTKQPAELRKWEMDPEMGWVLLPGVGYLMHTVERVCTDNYVPVLDGKSSIGRLFVKVHETAGYGDCGFDGQYTLEVTSLFPVRVYPGMRFCQMRFCTIQGVPISYQSIGHYTGQDAVGALLTVTVIVV